MSTRHLFAIIALLVGCGGDDSPTSQQSLAGTYTIQSATVQVRGATETLTPPDVTGSFTLTAGGRYDVLVRFTGMFFEAETGTYTVTGNTITITPDDEREETPSQITVNGNTITVLGSFDTGGFASTEVFVK